MGASGSYVSFGMYPFEPLRPAWESLWAAVQRRVPSLPPAVRWDVQPEAAWADPRCAASQACGWPVATSLRGVVAVVGAFSLRLAAADGHRYRSVIAASAPGPLAERDLATTVAAASSDESLSGWISLRAAGEDPTGRWPGPVTWTGTHLDSLRAITGGDADVASVDAVSWAHICLLHPDVTEELHVIGRGPLVPSLPVIVPASASAADTAALAEAFMAAMADPLTTEARAELLFDGFVPLDDAEYDSLPSKLAGTLKSERSYWK